MNIAVLFAIVEGISNDEFAVAVSEKVYRPGWDDAYKSRK